MWKKKKKTLLSKLQVPWRWTEVHNWPPYVKEKATVKGSYESQLVATCLNLYFTLLSGRCCMCLLFPDCDFYLELN